MHSKGARLVIVGIAPRVLDLGGQDRVTASMARCAAPMPRVHLAWETYRQVSIVELAQNHLSKAAAVHGPTLRRRLAAHEHIIGAATELALSPGDEEFVALD